MTSRTRAVALGACILLPALSAPGASYEALSSKAQQALKHVAEAVRAAYGTWRRGLRGARPEPAWIPRYRDQLIQWIEAIRSIGQE
jgi:hypothetical protein